jgi:hypothetical protein
MSDKTKRPSNLNAFPGTDANGYVCEGMTLRDWFAGQALPGLVPLEQTPRLTAAQAYSIADAMLAARDGGK